MQPNLVTIHSRRRELRGRQADDATCGNSSVQVSVDQAHCLLSFDWATAIYKPPKALTASQGIQHRMTRRHGCDS